MNFERSEQQTLLADTLARFAREHESPAFADVWSFLAESGYLALPLPERCGGLGGAADDLMVTFETLGRSALAVPLNEASLAALALCDGVAADDLARLLDGTELWLAALTDNPRHPLAATGDMITGERLLVPFGAAANGFVVTLGGAEPLVLRIAAGATGLTRVDRRTMDGRAAANLRFAQCRGEVLARGDEAAATIRRLRLFALRAECAELTGIMAALFDKTVAYVNDRRQFGRAIAEFQAVRHRLADRYVDYEQCVAMSLLATLGGDDELAAGRAAAAKHFIATRAIAMGHDAIQLHGGMGTTTELDIAHYHTRIRVLAESSGAADLQLSRFARSPARGAAALDTATDTGAAA